MPDLERRQHFRLIYPLRARPLLVTAAGDFEVSDVSESGLRFWAPTTHLYLVGDEVDGTLILPGKRGAFHVHAHVVRHEASGAIAVQFDPRCELPFALIMKEQRYLITHGQLRTG